MGSVERIKNVAARVAKWHRAGYSMVVVPSAMSGETNRLIGLAKEIQSQPDPRELDMLLALASRSQWGCCFLPGHRGTLTRLWHWRWRSGHTYGNDT